MPSRWPKSVLEKAHELEGEILPDDVHMLVTRDYGETADEKVNELLGHLILAIITVIGLIAYSLGWREGLIVAAAVPITFALTLAVNLLLGYTINRVTLFALVLVLGLVCDDPIVDVENIHRHFSKRTLPPLQAVLLAVNEVRPPVIFATVAVILSFLPLLFITGMMGPYMRPMAINVPVAMVMSLLVAFTITPWMAYYLLRPLYGKPDPHAGKGPGIFMRLYQGTVAFFLDHRWSRWALLVLLVAHDEWRDVALAEDPAEDAPLRQQERVPGRTRHAGGRDARADRRGGSRFRALLRERAGGDELPGVRRYGEPHRLQRSRAALRVAARTATWPTSASTWWRRRSESNRATTSRCGSGTISTAIATKHGAKLKIVEMPPGPPVLATLVGEVQGTHDTSWAELVAAGRALEDRLDTLHVKGAKAVCDTDVMAEEESKRLDFVLDKEKAALHGVATSDVVQTLRLALDGVQPATVHEPDERQPLHLRLVLGRADRSGTEELSAVRVKGRTGALVPLAEIGRFVERVDDLTITHKDLERTVFVLGDVTGTPPAEIVFAVNKELREEPLPHGAEVDWSGEGEWKITIDVFRDLGLAFLGALIAIYALLVVETKSFFMPLVVMVSIPLGAIGIMPGFWVLNQVMAKDVGGHLSPVWFTATGMIGMIALAGIVIRNAIILIDFIRTRVAQGQPDARGGPRERGAAPTPDRADGVHDDARRVAHHARPDLLRPRLEPDLRDPGLDRLHARRDSGRLLRPLRAPSPEGGSRAVCRIAEGQSRASAQDGEELRQRQGQCREARRSQDHVAAKPAGGAVLLPRQP